MLYLQSGIHALSTIICVTTLLFVICNAIDIFIIGRIKRLELLNLMLKQEYTLREFSDIENAMDNLEYACDCAIDVRYKEKEINKFKKQIVNSFLIFCLSLVTSSLTKSTFDQNIQQIRTQEVSK